MKQKRKSYDRFFKEKAVELANFKGNVPKVAEELDIDKDLLYRWKREQEKYEHNIFPGKGKQKLTDEEKEIAPNVLNRQAGHHNLRSGGEFLRYSIISGH